MQLQEPCLHHLGWQQLHDCWQLVLVLLQRPGCLQQRLLLLLLVHPCLQLALQKQERQVDLLQWQLR